MIPQTDGRGEKCRKSARRDSGHSADLNIKLLGTAEDLLRNHRDVLGMRGNRLDPKLRQREIDFLSNVRRSRHAPSGGQEKWLGDIQARIRRAA